MRHGSFLKLLAGSAVLGSIPAQGRPVYAPLAPVLARTAPLTRELWRTSSPAIALARLADASPEQRQRARWVYARSLLNAGQAAEGFGVLQVMVQDEPDLALAEPFQLAFGRALVELRRGVEAVAALDRPGLAQVSEACAWRLRALELASAAPLTVRQVPCAVPAINARRPKERESFIVPAARAAVAAGQPAVALRWLRATPAGSPAVGLVRGQALLAWGKSGEAIAQFAAVRLRANGPQQAEAELGWIEARLRSRRMRIGAGARLLAGLQYRWRGGEVEQGTLLLLFKLARHAGDDRGAMRAAATLVRYHALGPRLAPLLGQAQAMLASVMSPDSPLPLDQAAGLYWEYRDLAPGGGEGDLLALRLAERLQQAGLYARAADLLEHQLTARAHDLAQGPLSVRVAKLHILAGRPERALEALRMSSAIIYPATMLHDRQRVEAVALQLGRGGEALAVLQNVPGSGPLQAELLWKQRSWAAFAQLVGHNLPPAGALSEVEQAVIFRQAITLGMLGREGQLEALRARYADAFARLPTARAFEVLTRPAGEIDAEALTGAMASIPSASPAGEYADLLDAAPAPERGA